MDSLLSLVRHNSKKKLKYISSIADRLLRSEKKMGELYALMSEKREKVDPNEIAKNLGFKSMRDPGFQTLKKDLKLCMINCLFLVDPYEKRYGNLESAYMNCWREWAAARILFLKGATATGVDMAGRVFHRSRKYQFTDLAMHASRSLRMHYATRGADQRKYEIYDTHFNYYQELFYLENKAESYYTSLMTHFSVSRSSKPEISEQAFTYFAELAPYLERFSAHRFHRFVRFIELVGYMSAHNYREAVRVCDHALRELSRYKYMSKQGFSSFIYQKLVCHTKLGEFKEGQEAIQMGLALEKPGSFNWFKNRELSIILALHTQKYTRAYQIYQEASKEPGFKKLEPVSAEMWKIIQGYIRFLELTKRVTYGPSDHPPQRFRLGKFVNEVPHFSKDKRGMNIAIIILQIIFTIGQKKYDQSIDSIAALEKYCSRYLRRDDTFRSNCFIKMLLQVPTYGFQRIYVERHAEKYVKQLESMPIAHAPQGPDIELIPYEDLWLMVLDSLSLQHHWPRKEWAGRRHK